MLRQLFNRLRAKRAFETDMSEEMRVHIQMQLDANLAAGMDPDEARHRAQRQFGHVEGFKEECRDGQRSRWIEECLHDARYGFRMLRKHRGFTVITVLTLAIGIGATTTIFSIVNNIVLRPLPFPDSGRLATVFDSRLPKFPQLPVSVKSYLEWKKQATTLQSAALNTNRPFVMTGAGEPARKFAYLVTPEFFNVLGVPPFMGRTLTSDDGVAGRNNVMVLNYKFWVSQFNSDPDVVGRKVLIDEKPVTIVGVMPPSFYPESMTDPWAFMPLVFEPRDIENYNGRFARSIVRLKPGVTFEQAASELTLIEQRLAAQFPNAKTTGITVIPMLEQRVGRVRPLLFTLLGAVGFLLLIACVNVANLLLARSTSRQREIAVRTALGASRARIIRQLLCESVLISLLGSVVGVALAYLSKDFLLSFGPLDLPRSKEIAIDGTALLFTCGLGALTGIGFGLAPALHATRINLPEVMKDGGRGSSDGGRRMGVRGFLVVCEVGLALILLISAGLLIRSFDQMRHVNLGFEPGEGVTFTTGLILPQSDYGSPEKLVAFADRVTTRVAEVPGVQAAALTTGAPDLNWRRTGIEIEGRPDPKWMEEPPTSYYITTPRYFDILRIKLHSGRLYDEHDRPDTRRVAVVSEGFVRKYFPNENPLGKHIRPYDNPPWREIVGIVGDVREDGPVRPSSQLQLYEPYVQKPVSFVTLLFRADHKLAGLRGSVRRALDEVDRNLPLSTLTDPLDMFLRDSVANQRFTLFILGVFSVVALLLSALGIYGVVAYSVTQRTQEIGIRMALGAQAADILRMIFSQTGRMILLGLALGIAGALAATRLLGSILFEVGAQDPITFTAVPILLAGVALLACWIPARRAARVNPLVALRHE